MRAALALGALCVLIGLAAPAPAHGQPQPEGGPALDRAGMTAPGDAPAAAPAAPAAPRPETGGLQNSKGVALLFWALALAVIGGALFIITRRNLVAATMGMVGTFFAIAGLFVMLYAHFLAAIQVLVYAGAIMVLFVFVVMILNKEEEEPWALQGLLGKGLALVSLVYLLTRMGEVLWAVKDVAAAAAAPVGPHAYPYGTTRALGHTLFRDYLFPFEAVSLVLLIAVVGALAITRGRVTGEEAAPP